MTYDTKEICTALGIHMILKVCPNCVIIDTRLRALAAEAKRIPATAPGDISDEAYRQAARREWGSVDGVDVDLDATVSRGDDSGAYVQAWVWINDEEIIDQDKKEGP